MTKAELITAIAKENNLLKKDVETVYNAIFEKVAETVMSEKSFRINGFGTFTLKERAERKGRNPQTGEEITIAAKKTIGFKVAKELNDKING